MGIKLTFFSRVLKKLARDRTGLKSDLYTFRKHAKRFQGSYMIMFASGSHIVLRRVTWYVFVQSKTTDDLGGLKGLCPEISRQLTILECGIIHSILGYCVMSQG